jgi:hypothetical protein
MNRQGILYHAPDAFVKGGHTFRPFCTLSDSLYGRDVLPTPKEIIGLRLGKSHSSTQEPCSCNRPLIYHAPPPLCQGGESLNTLISQVQ